MKKILNIIKTIIALVLLAMICVVGYVIYDCNKLYKEAVEKTSIKDMVDSIKQDENYLDYKEIPELFVDAIIAVEDHRFYIHNGFDIVSFTRAMVTNVQEKSLAQGGSTLTQQLAKNMYFSFEKKFSRKIAELIVAFELEKQYEKEEIIALYINTVYFGDGYYGLKEAAEGYFDKTVDELTEDEITLLAGLPKAPSLYALSKNEDLARKRQEVVIECLKNYMDNK